MSPLDLVLVAVAGLLAGGVNAVAGGGSLVLFPALLLVGLPPLAANVTNSVAVWPGYVGTTAGYRPELEGQRRRVLVLGATAAVGGLAGALLLLVLPAAVFDAVVPALVVLASLLLAVQPRVTRWVARLPGSGGGTASPLLHLCLLLAGAYGGYFGGALGVVLLVVLAVFLPEDLQRLNALKAVLSLVVSTVALVAFVLAAPVELRYVAVAAPAALLGGYLGARLARRLPAAVLRAVVVGLGLTVGALLAL